MPNSIEEADLFKKLKIYCELFNSVGEQQFKITQIKTGFEFD